MRPKSAGAVLPDGGPAAGESPAPLSTAKLVAIAKMFRGKRCLCGGEKKANTAFCGACYFILPRGLRAGLWAKFGDGFAEAYEKAADWLTKGD